MLDYIVSYIGNKHQLYCSKTVKIYFWVELLIIISY